MNKRIRKDFPESLGRKMLISAVAGIVIVLTAFTIFAVMSETEKAKAGLRGEGSMLSELLAHQSVVGVYTENGALLKEAAQGIVNLQRVTKVILYRADRKPLYAADRSSGHKDDSALSAEAVSGLTAAGAVDIRETSDAFEFIRPVSLAAAAEQDESLYFSAPASGRKDRTIGYARIALSKEAYHREIASIIARQAGIMIIFIVSSVFLISFRLKRVTRPLEQLTENVKALGRGQRVDPVPVETGDEVGKLAQAFNAMVAAREEAEESLRESEERYRRLVELSPDAIYVQIGDRIVLINRAGARLLGAAGPEEVLEKDVTDLVHPDDREAFKRFFRRVGDENLSVPILPVRFVHADGTALDAEAAAAPFSFDGRDAILVIARDVTERKGLEEMVREYERELHSVRHAMSSLESQVEERERHLIAADLHDYVGQNLVLSLFKLGLLKRMLPSPEAQSQVDDIRELVGQTIQYTRSLTVELSPPVLAEIGLAAAVTVLAEGYEKLHGLKVILDDDGAPDKTGEDARNLLFRSIRELLMNVVKHAHADRATVTLRKTGEKIVITVHDDGKGFDAAAAAGNRRGFGLYSIRERLDRLGGSCGIKSGPGRGTKVILTAPVKN